MSLISSMLVLFMIQVSSTQANFRQSHRYHKENPIDGTREPSKKELDDTEAIFSDYRSKIPKSRLHAAKDGTVNINVYWNTLTTSEGEGALSVDSIEKQMRVLNDAFSGAIPSYGECDGFTYNNFMLKHTPFRFVLGEINEFDGYDDLINVEQSIDNLRELHHGTCSDLNIFSGDLQYTYKGSSSYPWDCQQDPQGDVVLVDSSTLPDQTGYSSRFNQGDSLVTQVGHWLGLYKVYQGSCNGRDYVIDTPAQKYTYGCPVNKNTCGSPGKDLIHNFMDNSDDCCRYSFTNGQVERMILQAELYRDLNTNVTLPTVLPLTCDFPNDELNYSQCDVENPCWVGDGYCDSDAVGGYNTEGCHSDGGDCVCDFPDDWFNYSSCPETYACSIGDGTCDWDLQQLDECNNDSFDCYEYFDDDYSDNYFPPELLLFFVLIQAMAFVCAPCIVTSYPFFFVWGVFIQSLGL